MQQVQMAERNARGGLVCDRTALKYCEQNPAIALLKRQCRQPLEQIDRHIGALDAEIAALGAADAAFGRRHQILTSIAGVGTLTANQFIAAMPELGSLENKQAAALAGLAPVARRSRQRKGKSLIRGGAEPMSGRPSRCQVWSPRASIQPSKVSISSSSMPESLPKSPSCESSPSPQTPRSKLIDAWRNLRLDHHGHSNADFFRNEGA
jgi:hypothetical protein